MKLSSGSLGLSGAAFSFFNDYSIESVACIESSAKVSRVILCDLKNVEVWRPRIAVFVSAHLKGSLEVSLKRKEISLAKIYSSLPAEKIVVESC